MLSKENSLEQKLNSYSRSPKYSFKASRSINPEFPHISKFDDVTRYNSANYNVYFYKDYPNRAGTPIKAKRDDKAQGFRKSLSPIKHRLQQLINNGIVLSDEAKKNLFEKALQAQFRSDTSPPKLNKVSPGPSCSTMNDFHKRETNAGYARNGGGGFYTR